MGTRAGWERGGAGGVGDHDDHVLPRCCRGGEFFFFKVTGHGLSRSLVRLCGEQLSEVSVSFDFVGTV